MNIKISKIMNENNLIGYKIEDNNGTNLLISESLSRTKDMIDYIISTEEYEFDFNGLKCKQEYGYEMPIIDLYSLSEVDKISVQTQYPNTIPIEKLVSQDKIEQKQTQIMAERLNGSESISKLATTENLLDFLSVPKLESNIRYVYPLNSFTAQDAMFDYDTLRSQTAIEAKTDSYLTSYGDYSNMVSRYLTFTVEEWRKVLELLRNNNHITENSTPIEVLKAYFQFGYPGINEPFNEIQIIDKNNYYVGRNAKVYTPYIIDPMTSETIIPTQGLKATSQRQNYTPKEADEVNIGYIADNPQSSAVLLKGSKYDTLITSDEVLVFRSQQRIPVMHLPMIKITLFNGMSVLFNDINLLSRQALVNTLNRVCVDTAAETLSYEIRPKEGRSTYDILKSCPMSIFSIIKYVMTEELQIEIESIPAAEAEIKKEQYLTKTKYIDLLLRNYQDLDAEEELFEAVGEISQEYLHNYINDIITGAVVVGTTHVQTQRIKEKFYNMIKEYLYIAKTLLNENLQTIVNNLIENIEALKEVRETKKELTYSINVNGKSLKLEIPIDSNAIINANKEDYESYTSMQDAKLWMYCTEAYKQYGKTNKHIGMKYLAWPRSNSEGKYNQVAMDIEKALRDGILEAIIKSELPGAMQIKQIKYMAEKTAEVFAAQTIFNIARDKVPYQQMLNETNYGNYITYEITLNVKNVIDNAVISISDGAFTHIKKVVKEYADSLQNICEAAVTSKGIVRHIVNAEVTPDTIIPKLGFKFLERDAFTVCIHSNKVQIREILRRNGCYDAPAGYDEPIVSSLESVPSLIQSPKGSLVSYGHKCIELMNKAAEQKENGRNPIKVVTDLELDYPYFYPAQEDEPVTPENPFKPIPIKRPRIYTREIALSERENSEVKAIGITDRAIVSGYTPRMPLQVFKAHTLQEIGMFLIKDAVDIFIAEDSGVQTVMYDIYKTEQEFIDNNIPFLKFEDNGRDVYVLKGQNRLYLYCKER